MRSMPGDWLSKVTGGAGPRNGAEMKGGPGPVAGHLGARRAAVAADVHHRHRHRDLDDGQLAILSAAAEAGGDTAPPTRNSKRPSRCRCWGCCSGCTSWCLQK
ncbi:hypothetical protein ACIQ9E_26615 [Streptomyces sp. NPDC094448]|uniref:hypothetical protein n=1 Tax=Streptomyces sp. NPDC094448 TaxID=3366063 RepID=UPI0037F9ADFF